MNKCLTIKMDNQQPSPEQGKVQRLSRKGVGRKRLALEVVSVRKDEDIVYTLMKVRGALVLLNNKVAFIVKVKYSLI